MDWMKIAWAILIGMMIIWLLPRAKDMLSNSPKATSDDWRAFILPLVLVIGFVVLLVMSVRN